MTADLHSYNLRAEEIARKLADYLDYTAAGHMMAAANAITLQRIQDALQEMDAAAQEAGTPRRTEWCTDLSAALWKAARAGQTNG